TATDGAKGATDLFCFQKAALSRKVGIDGLDLGRAVCANQAVNAQNAANIEIGSAHCAQREHAFLAVEIDPAQRDAARNAANDVFKDNVRQHECHDVGVRVVFSD